MNKLHDDIQSGLVDFIREYAKVPRLAFIVSGPLADVFHVVSQQFVVSTVFIYTLEEAERHLGQGYYDAIAYSPGTIPDFLGTLKTIAERQPLASVVIDRTNLTPGDILKAVEALRRPVWFTRFSVAFTCADMARVLGVLRLPARKMGGAMRLSFRALGTTGRECSHCTPDCRRQLCGRTDSIVVPTIETNQAP